MRRRLDAWRMTHCAMSIAFANKNKHVISTRDIKHVIRILEVKFYRDNLLIQKKQDVVSTLYSILVFINTQCRRIFEFVTRSQKKREKKPQNEQAKQSWCYNILYNKSSSASKSNESRCRRIEVDDENHEFERFSHFHSSNSVLVDMIYFSLRRNIHIRLQLE